MFRHLTFNTEERINNIPTLSVSFALKHDIRYLEIM